MYFVVVVIVLFVQLANLALLILIVLAAPFTALIEDHLFISINICSDAWLTISVNSAAYSIHN